MLKGAATDFVTVRVPGGTIGRYRYVFVGAPTFTQNEQVVLLLKRGSDNALRPIGLWQGVYRVEAMPGTGQPVIAAPAVAPQTASTGLVVRGDTRRRLDLGDGVRVARAARHRGAGPGRPAMKRRVALLIVLTAARGARARPLART